jgi:hypothetical protein
MSVKKVNIDGNFYDVISWDEYTANPSIYDKNNAIIGPDGLIYPIRGKNDIRPGIYADDVMAVFREPTSNRANYSSSRVIDFSKPKNYAEVIEACAKLQEEERQVLTTINNVTIPEIDPDDNPEMVALKQGIIDKHIDLDSYAHRFGPNFNNDKRLLNRTTISMSKLKTYAENLDMRVFLTLEDASSDVPNPLGHKITVEITGKEGDDTNE